MKQWCKMKMAMLNDGRFMNLLEEYGIAGVGAYSILYLILECQFEGAAKRKDLIQAGNEFTGRKLMERILDESSMFYEDTDGKIHSSVFVEESLFLARARTQVRTDARTEARTGASHPGDNIYLLLEKKEQELEKEKKQEKKDENLPEKIIPSIFENYRKEPWFPLVYPLTETGGENGLWFQEVCHSAHGWSLLLARQWQQAIAHFMSFLLRKRKGDGIRDKDEAKNFFSNYVDSPYTGPRLREYLMKVEKNEI